MHSLVLWRNMLFSRVVWALLNSWAIKPVTSNVKWLHETRIVQLVHSFKSPHSCGWNSFTDFLQMILRACSPSLYRIFSSVNKDEYPWTVNCPNKWESWLSALFLSDYFFTRIKYGMLWLSCLCCKAFLVLPWSHARSTMKTLWTMRLGYHILVHTRYDAGIPRRIVFKQDLSAIYVWWFYSIFIYKKITQNGFACRDKCEWRKIKSRICTVVNQSKDTKLSIHTLAPPFLYKKKSAKIVGNRQ